MQHMLLRFRRTRALVMQVLCIIFYLRVRRGEAAKLNLTIGAIAKVRPASLLPAVEQRVPAVEQRVRARGTPRVWFAEEVMNDLRDKGHTLRLVFHCVLAQDS